MTKFPHLLAAVEAREKHLNDAEGRDQWAIGAAVIKDCELIPAGARVNSFEPRGRGHPKTERRATIEKAAEELAKHGFDYKANTLADMAATVAAFPVNRRHSNLSFTVHQKARNPDLLDWIVKQAGDKLSSRDVDGWVSRWHSLQDTKRREKIEAVKEKKRHATTLDEKRKAAEELKKLGNMMPTPKEDFVPPSKKDQSRLSAMADLLNIDVDATSATRTLRKNLAAIREMEGDIDPGFIGALVEHHQQLAEVATQIADLLGKSKKGRFSVLKGGAA